MDWRGVRRDMVTDPVFRFLYCKGRGLYVGELVEKFKERIVYVRDEVDGSVDYPPGVRGRESGKVVKIQ